MARARKTTLTAQQRRWAREAHAGRRSRGPGGFRTFFALLLLLPTLALQAATTTSAGAAVVAGFEIDGNTPDDAVAGTDWDALPAGTHATDPVGNVDTTTFKGSKEFEHPNTWVNGVGLAPNQDDISDVYFHDAIVDGDIWGYVGFRRFTTSGTTNFDVEFNKLANSASSTFVPIRSVGDVMVRFEQDGNSAFALTAAWFWTRTSSAAWGGSCIEVPGYSPASGWCSQNVASVPFTGATGESGHFAEGAFNFSSLLEQGGIGGATCEGGDFGTMNIRSFTGNADESALKDYVNPVTIDIDDTCGELEIYKVDQFGNSVPGATFSFSPNPVPGQSASPLVIVEGGAGDPDGEADGDIVIDPATPGTYTVIETAAPPGFELVQPVSARTWTITVGEGGVGSVNTPLTVTNRRYFQAPTVVNQPSYDIDYNWLVTKSVADPKSVNVPQGTDASFDYEVRLKALDASTSGFGGTVTVTNPNALDMVATLSAQITGGAGCTVVDADTLDVSPNAGLQVNLDNGANVFTYTCPAASLPGGTTATAAWNQAVYPSSDPAETYTRSDAKAFAIDQKVDETTTVTDTFNGGAPQNLGTFDWSTVRASNDPAAHTVVVATYQRDIAGVPGTCTDYPNTARESADDTSDSETVTVCVGANLNVTKDANLGYQRELLWDIAKSGPGTVFVGEDAQGNLKTMVDFTVDVTADGMSDSAWALTGSIFIDNPNAWPVTVDVTDTVVVDTKTIECTIDGGSQVVVPANAVDHEVTYDCPGVEQGDYVGKNTVKIDWSKDSHAYPKTDDSDTVDVQVTGDPDPANATVTLTDLLEGEDVTADLPQSSFDWAAVHAMAAHTQSLTYSVELDTQAGKCTTYTNVVSIDQVKDATDDADAIICAPGVSKSVTADYGRKQLWDLAKDVDKTSVEIAEGGTATFHYTVTATPGAVVDNGEASWSGSITVSNPSTDEALTVDVTDIPAVAGWTCSFVDDNTQVEIAAGDTATIDYTCAGSGHPSGTNKAVVSFGDESVSKTVNVAFAPRQAIDDTVVPVYDDKTDPEAPPVLLGEADANDDGTWDFAYSLTKPGVAGKCTTYTNTAVIRLEASDDVTADADAEVCVEKPIKVEVSGGGNYGVTYPWDITKDVDKTSVEVGPDGEATFGYTVTVTAGEAQPAGWTLSGSVKVDNPNTYAGGAITLTDLDISTDVGGGADCTATLPAAPVAPEGSVTIPFSCTFTGTPDTSGTVTADVQWDPAGDATSATASDTSDVSLTVGEETNKVVDVIDDKTDPANPKLLESGLVWSDGLVKSYEYSLTLPGTAGTCVDYTNTAVVDLTPAQQERAAGLDEDGNPYAQQTVTVCEETPLEPEVSGSADLARAYAWSIAKVADATQRTVDASGTATFTYTVTAKAGAATDSGWQLKGSVTIVNPNQYADGDITADVTAATNLGGGSACTVSGGNDVAIPASDDGVGSVTLPIACTFSSQPAGSGALDVTATWDPAGEATTASASDSTPIAFTVRSETNKTVQVVDDKTVAGQRTVLDPALTWAEGLVKSYTYSLALAGGGAGACQSHTNTATIDLPVGTDPTASAVVLVCMPEVLPEQSFGKAVGSVKASCQGTVKAKLANRSGETVTYKLRVGSKVHRITVKAQSKKKFVTQGRALAKVTLKVGSTRLDKLRIPALCEAPEVLPDTGLRATSF